MYALETRTSVDTHVVQIQRVDKLASVFKMSALSFAVHNDKENATPAGLSKGLISKSFGSRAKGVNVQPTPRKALIDVNQIGILNNFPKDSNQKETKFKPVKPSTKFSAGIENFPQGSNIKKPDAKKTPKIHRKGCKILKGADNGTSLKVKKNQPATSQLATSFEDEYDSDTIFPRNQRLSSYVDKLLTWRPPCLFGTIPDSETESDPEDLLIDKLVNATIVFPEVSVPEFNEKDLDSLMMELPPLEIPESEDKTMFESTPNTSLSLGTLQMLNNYEIESVDNHIKH